MDKRVTVLAAALFVLLAAGAYVWDGVTKQPEVNVTGVNYRVVDSVSLLGVSVPMNVSFNVAVDVSNPNIVSANLVGGRYDVYVNDVRVGDGIIPEAELPAGKTTSLETEVRTSAASGLKAGLSAVDEGEAAAAVSGTAYVELPLLGVREIPFHAEQKIV